MSYYSYDKEIPLNDRIFAAAIWICSFFTAFIGPILIWLIKKDDSEFINQHGKEYFNLLISFFIYYVIAIILSIILIGVIVALVLAVLQVVFTIIAAIKAFDGEVYHIPFVFHFFK